MLALTLKVGQKLAIGDSGVFVELLRGGSGSIRLGVTAPKDQKIVKGELQATEPAPEEPNA